MQITAVTTFQITIEDDQDLKVWQSLFTKLYNHLQPVKPMDDSYKTTTIGYLKRFELTKEESELIDFVYKQIKQPEKAEL